MKAALASIAGAAILSCGGPASAAGTRFTPTVELRQIVSHNDIDDETVTYTEVGVGVNGTIDTRRIKATLNYSYGRRFVEKGSNQRENRHSLFTRADIALIDNRLDVSLGGFAALLNRDLRGQVSFSPDQANPNLVQTYSAYIEPHYRQPLGDVADLDLNYRVGYYNVGGAGTTGQQNNGIPGSGPNDIVTDRPSDSVNQTISAKLGNREKGGRFRFDLTGTATLEDIGRLDQKYRAYDGRFEVEYAVRRGVGLIANVGYEHIRNSQVEVLRDATGLPVPGPDGDFQIDPTGARRSLYSQQGLSYEGGFRLQPTRRTLVNIRAGKRFGNFSVNGDARYEYSPRLVFGAVLVERIDSFGRLLTRDLDGIRVQSVINTSQSIGLSGCVYGAEPGGGGCLFNASQSITNATFRTRAAQLIVEARHGRTNGTLAVIFNRRKFLDTQALQAPGTPLIDGGIAGGADETITADARLSRALGQGETIAMSVFASRSTFALAADRSDKYVGGNGQYMITLGRRIAGTLSATAAKRFSNVAQESAEISGSAGLSFRF